MRFFYVTGLFQKLNQVSAENEKQTLLAMFHVKHQLWIVLVYPGLSWFRTVVKGIVMNQIGSWDLVEKMIAESCLEYCLRKKEPGRSLVSYVWFVCQNGECFT